MSKELLSVINKYRNQQPEPEEVEDRSTGVLGDTGRMVGLGLNQLADLGGFVLEKAGAERAGQWVQDRAQNRMEELELQLTPEQQAANQKQFTRTADGERGVGEAWTDPRSYLGLVAQSAAPMAAGLGAGSVLSKAATWALRGSRTAGAAVGYGAGEGMVAGGLGGKEVVDAIRGASYQDLAQLEPFQQAYHSIEDESLTHKEKLDLAREKVETSAFLETAGKTGAITGILSAPSGVIFDRMLRGVGFNKPAVPRRSDVLKYAAAEGAQEMPQEGSEAYLSAKGIQKYVDPSIDPTENVLEGMVAGGIAGAGMGVGFGGGAHLSGRRRYQQAEQRKSQLEQTLFDENGQARRDADPRAVQEYLDLTDAMEQTWGQQGQRVASPYREPQPQSDSQLGETIPGEPFDRYRAGLEGMQDGETIPGEKRRVDVLNPEGDVTRDLVVPRPPQMPQFYGEDLGDTQPVRRPLGLLPSPVEDIEGQYANQLPLQDVIYQGGPIPQKSPRGYDPRGSSDDVQQQINAPGQTVPEPEQTKGAQIDAFRKNRKPAVLFTPGQTVPRRLPKGAKLATVPDGTLMYRDEASLEAALDGRMGEALGYGIDQKPVSETVVTARDNQGRVVQDVLTDGRPEVFDAAQQAAGEGGSVEQRSAQEALSERVTTLQPERRRFIESKVRELGSVDAVDAKYRGKAPVDAYAREFARQQFGSEARGETRPTKRPAELSRSDQRNEPAKDPQAEAVAKAVDGRRNAQAFTVTDPQAKMDGYVFVNGGRKNDKWQVIGPNGKPRPVSRTLLERFDRARSQGQTQPYVPAGQKTGQEAGQFPDMDEMVREAARWRGAALNFADTLDNRGKMRVSKQTTKGDLDAYLMRRFGIDETAARDVSNELTRRNIQDDRSADPAEYAGEPWAKSQKPADLPSTDAVTAQTRPAGRTDAQRANDERLRRERNKVNPETDDIIRAISKLGGIDMEQARREWGTTITDASKELRKRQVFGKPVLRRKNGRTLDGMVEALRQYDYLKPDADGNYTINGLFEALDSAIRGQDVRSEQAQYDENIYEEAPPQPDVDEYFAFDDAELAEDGYNDLSDPAREAYETLAEQMDADFLERLAIESEGLSDAEYYQKAIPLLQERLGQVQQADAAGAGTSAEGSRQDGSQSGPQSDRGQVLTEQTEAGEQTKMFATPPAFGKRPQGQNATLDDMALYSEPLERAENARQGDMFGSAPTVEEQPTKAEKGNKQPQTAESTDTKIEDFGEKIGGARKDMTPSLDRTFSDDDIASMPLSKIWPTKEVDQIEDNTLAAIATTIRAEIPAKPRKSYNVDRWVEKVKAIRELMRHAQRLGRDAFLEKLRQNYTLTKLADKIETLENIDRKHWGRIESVQFYPDAFQYTDNGTVSKPMTGAVVDKRHKTIDGKVTPKEVAKELTQILEGQSSSERIQFEVRGRKGAFFINKKGDPERRRLKEFSSSKEAFDFLKDNYEDVVAQWEAVKERDNVKKSDVRSKENRPRAGANYRNGKDVTPEQFVDAFGFRGVEFGNWVGQGKNSRERQGMLNQAYDALMDLSNIVGIPPKAISLNGTLGLGFGSRGRGAAAAHFEPDTLAINLTKTRGAGSLGHEWFHALDNYFSRLRGGEVTLRQGMGAQNAYRESNFITHRPEPMMVHKSQRSTPITRARLAELRKSNPGSGYLAEENWIVDPNHKQGVRPEVESTFAELVKALDESPMRERSARNDKTENGYWSRALERAARAFENYVIDKMMKRGFHNDYLANVVGEADFARNPDRYPYLLESELEPIAQAFDDLFSTVKTKETDQGVVLYSRGQETATSLPKDTLQSHVAWIVKKWKDNPPINVVQNEGELPQAIRSDIAEANADGEVRGVFHRGSIYLVADNLSTTAQAEEALFHEALGHYGMRRLFGPQFNQSMAKLYTALGKEAGIRRLAEQYGIDLKDYIDNAGHLSATQRERMLVDELVSHLLGDNVQPNLVQRVVGAIRNAIRRMGLAQLADFNNADLLRLVRLSREAVTKGKRGSVIVTAAPSVTDFNQPLRGTPENVGQMGVADLSRIDQTQTKAFRDWFGDSKVVDENGEPLVVYHGTNGLFDEFSHSSDIGFHFGTELAARDRAAKVGGGEVLVEPITLNRVEKDSLAALNGEIWGNPVDDLYNIMLRKLDSPRVDLRQQIAQMDQAEIKSTKEEYLEMEDSPRFKDRVERARKGEGFRVEVNGEEVSTHETAREANARASRLREKMSKPMALYLSISNPIRLPDLGVWPAQGIAKEAGFNRAEMDRVGKAGDVSDQYSEVRRILQEKGYDGIVYRNEVENTGEDSWIAFSPTQIKSATGNSGTFDPQNPDIRYSRTPEARAIRNPALDTFDATLKKLEDRVHKVPEVYARNFGYNSTLGSVREALNSLRGGKTDWRTQLLDRYNPIKQNLGDAAYIAHRMLNNAGNVLATWLEHGGIKWDGGATTVTGKGQGFLRWYKELGQENGRKLLAWIAVQRAKKLEAEGRENLLTKPQRDELEAWIGNDHDWKALNEKFQSYNREILDLAQESGLINAEARKTWEDNFYIPFYREDGTLDEDALHPVKSKRHISAQIKRLKGGENKISDLLENTMRNWGHLIQESQRNVARAKAVDAGLGLGFIEEVTPPEAIRESKAARRESQIVSYAVDGKKRYVRVEDMALFNAMSEVNIEYFNGPVMRLFGMAKRGLTYGATFGPAFRVANMLRDTLHTAVVSKSFVPVVDTVKGAVQVMKNSDDYVAVMGSGGGFGQGYLNANDPKAMSRQIKKIAKREGNGAAGRILDTPRKMLEFWDYLGHVSEMAARTQLYTNHRQAGKTHEEAAFLSRDMLDFALSGESKSVRAAISVIPFLNARFQGLDRMYRGWQNDKRAFTYKGALLSAATLILWAAFKDDERYKELEDWEKWTYHHFWIGDMHYRIPKAFEVGALFSSLPEAASDAISGNEDGAYFGEFLWHTLSQTFALSYPALMSPALEVQSNKSFFTGRPIENIGDEQKPPGLRADPWTSETLKAIGEKYDISPKKLETLIRGHFATLGMTILGVSDIAYQWTQTNERPAKTINQYPLVGRFVREPLGRTKYATRMYDAFKEIDELAATINHYRKSGDLERARQVASENRDTLKYKAFAQAVKRQLSNIRKLERAIWQNERMDAEQKRERLDNLTERKRTIYKKAYEILEK